MKYLERALTDAWFKVKPALLKDPEALARRLARRRTPLLQRPPRAWCLGLRANDTRITPTHACIVPEHAVNKDHPRHKGMVLAHDVRLEKRLLKLLGGPVDLRMWRGHTAREAARKLGVNGWLAYQRKSGTIKSDSIKGLGGQRTAIPLVHAPGRQLDPNSGSNFDPPDPIWGFMWHYLADMLPDDLEQEVRRVPVYHRRRNRDHFHGWRWACPACAGEVKMLFFPLPVPSIVRYLGEEKRLAPHEADAVPEPAPTFACHDCHQIRYFSSTIHSSWNHVVAYLSGGMLYGREVERPEWFQVTRKRAYRRHNVPMVRGAEVERHLLNGLKYDQIAKEMNIALATVQGHVRRVYRNRGVHSRKQLIELTALKRRLNHEVHEEHEDQNVRKVG